MKYPRLSVFILQRKNGKQESSPSFIGSTTAINMELRNLEYMNVSSNIVNLVLGTRFHDRKTARIDQNLFTDFRCEFEYSFPEKSITVI